MEDIYSTYRNILFNYKVIDHSEELDANYGFFPVNTKNENTFGFELIHTTSYKSRMTATFYKKEELLLVEFYYLDAYCVLPMVRNKPLLNLPYIPIDDFMDRLLNIYVFGNPTYIYNKSIDQHPDFSIIQDQKVKESLLLVLLDTYYLISNGAKFII